VWNGAAWTRVWSNNGQNVIDAAWRTETLDISSTAAGRSQVRVRFGLGPTRQNGRQTTTSFGPVISYVTVSGLQPTLSPALDTIELAASATVSAFAEDILRKTSTDQPILITYPCDSTKDDCTVEAVSSPYLVSVIGSAGIFAAVLKTSSSSESSELVVGYSVAAPGGVWGPEDNGAFSVILSLASDPDSSITVGGFTVRVYEDAQTLYEANMMQAPADWSLQGVWSHDAVSGSLAQFSIAGVTPTNVITTRLTNGAAFQGDATSSHASSPMFSALGAGIVTLRFDRLLGVHSDDIAAVHVYDGIIWNTAWSNQGQLISDSAWSTVELDISRYAADRKQVAVRFVLAVSGAGRAPTTSIGWNVANVLIEKQASGMQCMRSYQLFMSKSYSNVLCICSDQTQRSRY